jgi:hypothetical protein
LPRSGSLRMPERGKRTNEARREADVMASRSGGIMRLANSGLKPIAMLLASMIELVRRVSDN